MYKQIRAMITAPKRHWAIETSPARQAACPAAQAARAYHRPCQTLNTRQCGSLPRKGLYKAAHHDSQNRPSTPPSCVVGPRRCDVTLRLPLSHGNCSAKRTRVKDGVERLHVPQPWERPTQLQALCTHRDTEHTAMIHAAAAAAAWSSWKLVRELRYVCVCAADCAQLAAAGLLAPPKGAGRSPKSSTPEEGL